MIKEKFISAAIGTLFFVVFQPFGISRFGMQERLLISCGLLVIAFASCLACEGIVRYVFRMPPDTGRGPRYMMRRGIVFQLCNILMLTVCLSLYFSRFVNNEQVDNHLSLEHSLGVLGASVGCCFFIGLYWRNVYWKRHYARQLQEAQLLNGVLMERARVAESVLEPQSGCDVEPERVVLEGSTRESVTLLLSDFLYAESEGNYVSIHYFRSAQDGTERIEQQTMLRTSMKNVVSTLCVGSQIMQCHRAFIVNLCHVQSVEGRSSGIGLRLRHCGTVVPVSKSYVSEVKERIKNPN